MNLYIRPDGSAQCVYDEKIALQEMGAIDIKRASHVEPDPNNPGNWFADLGPVGGPKVTGFANRGDALAYEIAWLEAQLALRPVKVKEVPSE
jgi:hypothetical protein